MKDRDYYFDNLKGLLIIFVIHNHFYAVGNIFTELLNTFDMPLFLMISGYFCYSSYEQVYGRAELFNKVMRRCLRLLVPIISYGVLNFIVYGMLHGFNVDNLFYCFVNTGLWFLYQIIFCTILMVITRIISRNVCIQLLAIVIVYGGLCLLYQHMPLIRTIIAFMPYFVMGYYYNYFLKNKNEKIMIANNIIATTCSFLFPITFMAFISVDVYQVGALNVFKGCIGAIFLDFIVRRSGLFQNKIKGITYIGKTSLQLYYIQMILTYIRLPEVEPFISEKANIIFNSFIINPVNTVAMLLLSCILLQIISKSDRVSLMLFGRRCM